MTAISVRVLPSATFATGRLGWPLGARETWFCSTQAGTAAFRRLTLVSSPIATPPRLTGTPEGQRQRHLRLLRPQRIRVWRQIAGRTWSATGLVDLTSSASQATVKRESASRR